MAAVLACAPAVASHFSAAWLFGLFRTRPRSIDVSTPTQRRPRREFFVHTAPLARSDLDRVEEIPVAGLARTKLDLAAILAPAGLERILERSEELGVFDLGPLEDVLGRYPRHPGAGALRRALDVYRPELAFTRSGIERHFLTLVRQAGLVQPAMNYIVAGMELDAYWERERFCVELDVYETHGTRAAFERDRIREDDLLALGIETLRITGPRLRREPTAVIQRLQAHLHRRQGPST